jgi:hypothetical protein
MLCFPDVILSCYRHGGHDPYNGEEREYHFLPSQALQDYVNFTQIHLIEN